MKKRQILKSFTFHVSSLIGFIFLPSVALAQRNFSGLVSDFIGIIGNVSWVLVGLAFILFLFGVVKFIYSSGDSKGNEEGKQTIIWGIVALVVLFSLWGITAIIRTTFGLS